MSVVQHVSQTSFRAQVLESVVPVLVDFYADWCGPCRMLAPVLDRLAQEFAGRAKIVKINVDSEPQLARQFRISSIPTLLLVSDGRVVAQSTGAASEAALRQALQQLIARSASSTRHAG